MRTNIFGFSVAMDRFILCTDHPDVFDAGIARYNRDTQLVHGFVRLHRRRTVDFVRRWVLPHAPDIHRLTRGQLKAMRETLIDTPWCGIVHRRMHDIRAKASRR